MSTDINQSPSKTEIKGVAKTRALAGLNLAVWNASQFLSYGQIRVICDIEGDEP